MIKIWSGGHSRRTQQRHRRNSRWLKDGQGTQQEDTAETQEKQQMIKRWSNQGDTAGVHSRDTRETADDKNMVRGKQQEDTPETQEKE
jgi:hypothetical protein